MSIPSRLVRPSFLLIALLVASLSVLLPGAATTVGALDPPPEFILPAGGPDRASIVGPEGGTVTTPDGRIVAVIPAGAVDEETWVLLAASDQSHAGSFTAFEFDLALQSVLGGSPTTDLNSPIPVELTPTREDLERSGTGVESLSLRKLNESTLDWVPLKTDVSEQAPETIIATLADGGRYALSAEVMPVAEDAQVLVNPSGGATLESGDGAVRLEFPPASADETLRVEYRPINRLEGGNFRLIRQFELNAFAIGRQDARVSTFQSPAALTVTHSPDEMAGLSYSDLRLYWLDESKNEWMPVPDQVNHGDGSISAPLDHFSIYSTGTMPYIAGPGHILWHQSDEHAGAATYDIPIELPAGPGGFKPPDLNLSYNSSRVDEMKSANSMGSWVGIGWELDAPSIRRDPATDRYYLDMGGVSDELIQTGTDTDGSTKWSTRSEQYQRIRSKTVSGQHAVFVVTAKDGTAYRFGTLYGLDQPLWYLTRWYYTWTQSTGWVREFYRIDLGRVVDTHQDYAEYSYGQTTQLYCPPGANPKCQTVVRSSYLSTIQWGRREGESGYRQFKVQFSSSSDGVSDRLDVPTCNVPLVRETRRLTQLELQVRIGTSYTPSKRYTFVYETEPGDCSGSGAMTLTSVSEKDRYGTSTLRTWSFDYDNLSVNYKTAANTCVSLDWPYLHTAGNGYGATTTLDYEYKWAEGPTESIPTWSRQVIASRIDDPGVGDSIQHTYTYGTIGYDGPIYYFKPGLDPIDAEYRGFREVTDTDATGDYRRCKYLTIGYNPYDDDVRTGHCYEREWFESGATSVKKVKLTWVWRYIAPDVNFVYPAWEYTYFGTALHTVYSGYDQYGNLANINEYDPETRFREIVFYGNTDKWIVGLPASEAIYRYDASPPYWIPVSKTTYVYDQHGSYTDPPTKGDLTREQRYDEGDVAHTINEYGYDDWGNKTSERKYRDSQASFLRTFQFESTYHAYVQSETDVATGQTTSYQYDYVLGTRTKTIDPNGQEFNVAYDTFGRVIKEWSPPDTDNSPTVAYVYDWDSTAPNRTTTQRRETAPGGGGGGGVLESFEWTDGLERTIQTRSEGPDCEEDVTVDTSYDSTGQKAWESIPYFSSNAGCVRGGYTNPNGSVGRTLHQYDAIGRETQVTDPNGNARTTTYSGFTETVVDENGHKTESVKDGFGRVVTVNQYEGTYPDFTLYATTTFSYDLLDRQTGVIDHFGNPSTTEYNVLGFKTETVDPDMGTWQYTYYDDGLVKTRTDARGEVVTYTYDSLDRLTTKSYSGPVPGATVTYTYDTCTISPCPAGQLGRLTRVSDWAGVHLYRYDARGRLEAERHDMFGYFFVLHSYDSMDREVSTTYPDYEVVSREYDAQGALASVSSSLGADYLASAEYDAAGQPTTLLLGNGVEAQYSYRPTDLRLTGIDAIPPQQGPNLLDYTYDYDPAGNIDTITDGTEGTTAALAYDELNRLTTVTGLSPTLSYEYDKIGNLIDKTEGPHSYDPMNYGEGDPERPHALTSATSTGQEPYTFEYDANGNMLTERKNGSTVVHQYEYDAEGQVSRRISPAEDDFTYTYGADGNLAIKVDRPGEPDAVAFLYIGDIFEKRLPGGEVTKYYFAEGRRIAMRKGGTLYYLTEDHLGGTALVTDASGAMVGRVRYYPYGGTRTVEGTLPTDKLFTGQQRETASGIYHYNARMYNADIGRFPQADTIIPEPQDPAAHNRYSYVYNNPVNYTDPTGRAAGPGCYWESTSYTKDFCYTWPWPWGRQCKLHIQNTLKLYVYKDWGRVKVLQCWVRTKDWGDEDKYVIADKVFAFENDRNGSYVPKGLAKEDTWYQIPGCAGPWRSRYASVSWGSTYSWLGGYPQSYEKTYRVYGA